MAMLSPNWSIHTFFDIDLMVPNDFVTCENSIAAERNPYAVVPFVPALLEQPVVATAKISRVKLRAATFFICINLLCK